MYGIASDSLSTPVVVVTGVLLLLLWYLMRPKDDLPPGPLKLPFISNAWWFVLKSKRISLPVAIMNVSKKYNSDVLHFKLGKRNIVFLLGYDTIHEALVKGDHFNTKPRWLVAKERKHVGFSFAIGQNYRTIKKFAMVALRDFGVGKTSLEEKILRELEAMTSVFADQKGQPYDPSELMSLAIANVIYTIMFGERLEYSNSTLSELVRQADAVFADGTASDATSSLMPKIIWRLLGNKEKGAKISAAQKAHDWVYVLLNEQITEHRRTYDATNIRDFVDLYLQGEAKSQNGDFFSVDTLFGVIVDLLVAALGTTYLSMLWLILYLQEYPDVQKKCQDEIQETYGDREIGWSCRGTLPYTEATFMEVQRIASVAEMTLPHTNEQEVVFGGYRIPKNSIVYSLLLSSHMDPKHWDSPDLFQPERHLKNGKLIKNPALMPFSVGARMCPGVSLVAMEMFLMMTNLLQRFTFRRSDESTKHNMGYQHGLVVAAPIPYTTRIISRK